MPGRLEAGEVRNMGSKPGFISGPFGPTRPHGTSALPELPIFGPVSRREMSLERVIVCRKKHPFRQPVL